MEKSQHKYKRRILVIDPKVQWTLAAYGIFLAVCSSVLTAALLTLQSMRLADDMNTQYLTVVVMGFMFFTLSILWGLVLSNQICGPIYRLHREIKAALSGTEMKPIKLRKHDQFKEVIADFNEVSKRWNETRN